MGRNKNIYIHSCEQDERNKGMVDVTAILLLTRSTAFIACFAASQTRSYLLFLWGEQQRHEKIADTLSLKNVMLTIILLYSIYVLFLHI